VPLPHPGSRGFRNDGGAGGILTPRRQRMRWNGRTASTLVVAALALAGAGTLAATNGDDAAKADEALRASIERGRFLVVTHGCGDCHGGYANPALPGYLAGVMDSLQIFQMGPFKTYP